MSCNGCRILRKGCSDNCILRQSLQGIESPRAQANATVFVAKFFGRAGLMSFLSSVPESQRPALFQSLLFEACGRTVNPVNGAVGLLWSGNWQMCQTAVETVLHGGVLHALPEFSGNDRVTDPNKVDLFGSKEMNLGSERVKKTLPDLDLGLTAGGKANQRPEKKRAASPAEESETTTLESCFVYHAQRQNEPNLLRLFT